MKSLASCTDADALRRRLLSVRADSVRALCPGALNVIAANPQFFDGRPHPIFGPLSRGAWLRWGYLHVDHHLRQFGA